MEPVLRLKAASDKRKKPDNHNRKEGKYSTSITDISITLSDCSGQSKSGFSIPTPSPTNKHTHSRVCVHLHTQHINENRLQPHHSAWHKNNSIGVCVCVCTGFPWIKLDMSRGDQGCCIQRTVWAQVSGVQRLF